MEINTKIMEEIFKMRLIDPEKFFVKLEDSISKLKAKGVVENDIQMSISLAVKKNLLKSIENGYTINNSEPIKVDERNFKTMGVRIPENNYPYNDKILIFSKEASYKQDEVFEILVSEIFVD